MAEAPASLRLGLIGAGAWGRNYIRTLTDGGLAGVALVRVASANPETAGLVPPGCALTTDYAAVAEADDLDGVIVATPAESHFALVGAALAAGNPVLAEKPLTLEPDQARALVAAARDAGLPLLVDHIHLFNPAFRALKARLGDTAAVTAISGRAGRRGPHRADADVLWDWGPHDVAMCLDLLGEMPAVVAATREAAGGGETWRVALTFPSGCRADLEFSNVLDEKTRRFAVTRGDRCLLFDDLATDKLTESTTDGADGAAAAVPHAADQPLAAALRHFAGLIRRGGHNAAEARLAADVVAVLARLADAA